MGEVNTVHVFDKQGEIAIDLTMAEPLNSIGVRDAGNDAIRMSVVDFSNHIRIYDKAENIVWKAP